MNLKSCVAAAALALLPMLSHAGVVYKWETIDNGAPRKIAFNIEFEDGAVQSGSYALKLDENDFRYGFPRPGLGLVSFSLGFGNNPFSLSYFNRDDRYQGHLSLDMNVSFLSDKTLSGYIRSSGFNTGFSMSRGNRGFEVSELRSDAFMGDFGCNGSVPSCVPIAGVIRQVPEPGTLALFGVGLLAASRIRRRKAL